VCVPQAAVCPITAAGILLLLEAMGPTWLSCWPVIAPESRPSVAAHMGAGAAFRVLIGQNAEINQQINSILTSEAANVPQRTSCDWLVQRRTQNIGGHTSKLESRE